MPRCSVGGITTVVPTAARGPSLYATAASGALWVVEVGVSNTTTTAITAALGVATTAGTQGTGLTEVCEDDPTHTVLGTGFQTHSADATLVNTRQAQLGAAVGSGWVWTFGSRGLMIPEGVANGIAITAPSGTGQNIAFYFVWDE